MMQPAGKDWIQQQFVRELVGGVVYPQFYGVLGFYLYSHTHFGYI